MTLYKRPVDTRIFDFNFAALEEIVAGETIVSATVTAVPTGPTLGSTSISGARVQLRISGGTMGVIYSILCRATLSSGSVVEANGLLAVVDLEE